MKTTALITRKSSLYILIGFLSLIITSCGSYQNSSYYDSDGIYGANGDKNVTSNNQPTPSSLQYKQYFESLQNTSSNDDIFTDVNSYSGGGYNTDNDSIQAPSTGYASWGSSPQETTVTVYPDTYWSMGFGWGYPYYGYGYGWGYPYYGWGYPGYGWGYPGYGWGYPGYGYPGYGYGHPIATPYAYNHSRRGSSYGGGYANRATLYNRNNVTNRNSIYSRNTISNRNNTYRNNTYSNSSRNSANNIVNRKAPTFTNRNNVSTSNSRNYNQSQSRNNSNYSQNRNNTSTQRSYTPSSNSSYRSSGSNMSGGGGRMSGGGGGGRSGGGGRR